MRRRHSALSFSGSMHFVTTVAQVRSNWFEDPQLCIELLGAFESARRLYQLDCFAYVLMPDHLHAVLLETTEQGTISAAMKSFKGFSTRKIMQPRFPAFAWRAGYDDVPIKSPRALLNRVTYTIQNPLRRKLVEHAEDFPWSSVSNREELKLVTICPHNLSA